HRVEVVPTSGHDVGGGRCLVPEVRSRHGARRAGGARGVQALRVARPALFGGHVQEDLEPALGAPAGAIAVGAPVCRRGDDDDEPLALEHRREPSERVVEMIAPDLVVAGSRNERAAHLVAVEQTARYTERDELFAQVRREGRLAGRREPRDPNDDAAAHRKSSSAATRSSRLARSVDSTKPSRRSRSASVTSGYQRGLARTRARQARYGGAASRSSGSERAAKYSSKNERKRRKKADRAAPL